MKYNIYCIDLITRKELFYETIPQAAKFTRVSQHDIREVLNNPHRYQSKGFTFGYSYEQASRQQVAHFNRMAKTNKTESLSVPIRELYFKQQNTYRQIADEFGLTAYQVRQVILNTPMI